MEDRHLRQQRLIENPQDSLSAASFIPGTVSSTACLPGDMYFIEEAVALIEEDGPLRRWLDGSVPPAPGHPSMQTEESIISRPSNAPNKPLRGVLRVLAALDSSSGTPPELIGGSQQEDEHLARLLSKEQLKLVRTIYLYQIYTKQIVKVCVHACVHQCMHACMCVHYLSCTDCPYLATALPSPKQGSGQADGYSHATSHESF